MNEPKRIDVNTFAERVGRSKRQIYKHIKSGRIPATKPNKNSSYLIFEDEVDSFIAEYGHSGSQSDTANGRDQARTDSGDTSQEGANVHEPERTGVNPPAEVYAMMLDRIARSERRNVELELMLRQHQNLLTENAESLQEGRAEVLQAEAKAKAREAELRALEEELKEARSTIADWESRRKRPWWKKMFSAG